MTRVLPVACVALCVVVSAAPPQVRTAEIHGRVIRAGTREPVRGAVVSIGAPPSSDDTGAPRRITSYAGEAFIGISVIDFAVETDGSPRSGASHGFLTPFDGGFVLRGIPAGAVTLTVSKFGYFPGAAGLRRPNGVAVPIVLEPGERRADVELVMWPAASMSGTVTDERGEPMAGVSVSIRRRTEAPEETGAVIARAVTDDVGRYSMGPLLPGEYIAAAVIVDIPDFVARDARLMEELMLRGTSSSRYALPTRRVIVDGRTFVHAGLFFGGAAEPAQATTIAVREGEERTGVDFRLELRPAVRISGTITDGTAPLRKAPVRLSSATKTATAWTGDDGRFEFTNLPADQYALAANRPSTTTTALATVHTEAPPQIPTIPANQDITNLTVALGRAPTVSGTLVVPADVSLEKVRIRLVDGAGTLVGGSTFASRGPFDLPNAGQGRYFVRIDGGSDGVWLESVEHRGRNITDVPLEILNADITGLVIHLTDRQTVVSGYVRRPDGKPAVNASVVLFPSDTSNWGTPQFAASMRFRTKRVIGGGYFFEGLPRGDYFLAAVDDALLINWHDRTLLTKLAGNAMRVTVGPGTELQRDLTIDER